jgi:hypothetical protein
MKTKKSHRADDLPGNLHWGEPARLGLPGRLAGIQSISFEKDEFPMEQQPSGKKTLFQPFQTPYREMIIKTSGTDQKKDGMKTILAILLSTIEPRGC